MWKSILFAKNVQNSNRTSVFMSTTIANLVTRNVHTNNLLTAHRLLLHINGRNVFRSFSTDSNMTTAPQQQPKSFVSRLRSKMEKSFEESKKTMMEQAGEENEKRMMNLLISTPKSQFNMKTLKQFYIQLKEEAEAKGDNFIASRDQQFQQGLDNIKRFLRVLDGFNEYEQEFPVIITEREINRVAISTMMSYEEVDIVTRGCKRTIDMHSWIQKRKEKQLPIPDKPQLIAEFMQKEEPRRPRLQGGFLAHMYKTRGAMRKKRLTH
jgi:hypothetical protein